jgi:myosin heavy subunit
MKQIDGVDDMETFRALRKSMDIMGFSSAEQLDFFRVIASILHFGNIKPLNDRSDMAKLTDTSAAERVCHVLGIPLNDFLKGLLKPIVKAGREWVVQSRTADQVSDSIESLARSIYERMFGRLVSRINDALDRPSKKATYIGVLDIAGFEIFDAC